MFKGCPESLVDMREKLTAAGVTVFPREECPTAGLKTEYGMFSLCLGQWTLDGVNLDRQEVLALIKVKK